MALSDVFGTIIQQSDPSVKVKFVYWEELTDAVEPNYEDTSVRGRSEPHGYYVNTGFNTFSFTITLHAGMDKKTTPDTIMRNAMILKSFAYPVYNVTKDILIGPPPLVIIQIGTFFKKRGRIDSPNFTYKAPYEIPSMKPHRIEASFSFTAIHDRPLGVADIRQRGLVTV